jgi:putative hydrolase of the HAD superfamily
LIKAIAWDFNGVIAFKKGSRTARALAKALGTPFSKMQKIQFSADASLLDSGRITYEKWLEKIIRELGKEGKISVTELKKISMKEFKQRKSIVRLAKRLRELGIKQALFSNFGSHLPEYLEQSGLGKEFNEVMVSCDAKVTKPSRESFLLVAKKLECNPGEIIFVDDHEGNVEAARKLGFKTVLFKNSGQCEREAMKLIILAKKPNNQ